MDVISAADRILTLDGARLEMWKCDGDICVEYSHCEIKDGSFLRGDFGRGETVEAACADYMRRISGKTLVFNAYSSNRREVTCLF